MSDEQVTQSPTQTESAPEAPATSEADFESMSLDQRAYALREQLRGDEPEHPIDEDADTPAASDDASSDEASAEVDPIDAKLAALQAKAALERQRVAAKKQSEVKSIDIAKKENELASIAHSVLEAQKDVGAKYARIEAFEKMSAQELIYEAMQRSGGDVNAVAQAFLDLNDPATIAGLQAKKREAETVNPLRKELDEIKAQLAQEARARQAAEQQSQMYAEINAAAQLSQAHADEVPFVSKLALKNQRLFMLRFQETRNTLLQEHGQAPTGSILLQMEQDLTPEINEIRETFGLGELPNSSQSSSTGSSGGVRPKAVTNRATSQRTQVAEADDNVPRSVDDRALELKRRLERLR